MSNIHKRKDMPLRYRAYAPIVNILGELGRIQVFGKYPSIVLRNLINRLMYLTVLNEKACMFVDTKQGFRILVPLNDQGAATILFRREYSPEETKVFERLVPFSSSFTDVGCNLGYFSLLVRSIVEDRYPIISIDPNSYLCELFSCSVEVNSFNNIKIINAAVGEKPGQAFFAVDARLSTSGQIFLEQPYDSSSCHNEIEIKTLEDLVPAQRTEDKVPLIKIDVEGHEMQVLKGGISIVKRGAIVLSEVWRDTAASLEEFAFYNNYVILNHRGQPFTSQEMSKFRRTDVILAPASISEELRAALS